MSVETKIDDKTIVKLSPPTLWKVVFLNDDFTPMDFVIELLTKIFKHSEDAANNITLEIHNEGAAVAGTYIHEIAEQKGLEATKTARANGFPLKITIEQETI
jgi:ATP-dependent Clp protease adaptor protein ClpS